VGRINANELARELGCQIIGDGEVCLTGAASIESAVEGDLTFLASVRAKGHLGTTGASAIIAHEGVQSEGVTIIVSKNPALSFARALWILYPGREARPGVSPLSYISEDAHIDSKAEVMPFVTIEKGVKVGKGSILFPGVYLGEGVLVGEDTVLYPSVTIYPRCTIGNRVIIHGGAVIGADGFGFIMEGSSHLKIPQIGTVVIEDDVEIGSNTAIDRGALGETRVERGTKVDNLVQIGHNVRIGEDSIIASQTGISGSVRIGDHVMLGGQTGVAGHLEIDPGIMVGAKSGIPSSLSAKVSKTWSGIPVMEHKKWLRLAVSIDKFPDLLRRIDKVEKALEKLSTGMEEEAEE